MRGVAMIERHVTFNVIPGKETDFETLFKDRLLHCHVKATWFRLGSSSQRT